VKLHTLIGLFVVSLAHAADRYFCANFFQKDLFVFLVTEDKPERVANA